MVDVYVHALVSYSRLTLMFFQRHLAPLGQPWPPWTWTEIEPAGPSVSATLTASYPLPSNFVPSGIAPTYYTLRLNLKY